MKIFCVGDLMLETLVRLPALPPQNNTLLLEGNHVELGGPAFNQFWHLYHFGRRPRLLGAAGKQDLGFVKSFLPSGSAPLVEIEELQGQTDRLFAFITPRYHRSVYSMGRFTEVAARRLGRRCAGSDVLLITGSRHPVLRRQYASISTSFAGKFLGFNPSYAVFEYSADELLPVLRAADMVCLNAQEEEHVRSVLKLPSSRALRECIKGILVITRSVHGVEVHEDARTKRHFPARKVIPGNAIGAGDAFLAAFVHEFIKEQDLSCAVLAGLQAAQILAESGRVRPVILDTHIKGRRDSAASVPIADRLRGDGS